MLSRKQTQSAKQNCTLTKNDTFYIKRWARKLEKKMKSPTNLRIFPLRCTLVYLVYRYLAPKSAINTIVLEPCGYKWCT